IAFVFFLISSSVHAQTPTDGILMNRGEICFGLQYTHESWDQYWEGTLKRSNGNIGTFTRQSVMGMFALGLTDKINVIGYVPWVHTESSGGQLKGVSGLQDAGIFLKAQAFHLKAGPGRLALNPVVGFSIPVSNYLEDYQPYSLGLGCPDLSLGANLQYKLDMGLYIRGTAAYHVRGDAKIEREFYYTTHGVYSDKVDMPNALTYTATLGVWLLNNSLNMDVTYDGLTTYGGFDIRRQDMPFPANKMIFTRVGGFIHYYTPFFPGFGIFVTGNQILTGRNVGESMVISGGLTYQFPLWNKPAAEESSN
ncbi:MAG TPA: hypothetical protein VJ508_04025, partial [Saprospiraceae bacterium]|nr:hypothetical protein [Saprospiraceae bacterium]